MLLENIFRYVKEKVSDNVLHIPLGPPCRSRNRKNATVWRRGSEFFRLDLRWTALDEAHPQRYHKVHVASLFFVGRGGCKNLTKSKSRTPGLPELHQEAHSREAQAAAYAKSPRWCVLWDVLRTLKSGIGTCICLLQDS